MSPSYAYPLASFGRFASDHIRTDAYVQALRDSITPESLVLNIGTGTGLFAILAAQMGARRVLAIEVNRVIDVARELAQANKVDDRIEFIHDFSTNVSLDERADVLVSDLRGILPLFEQHIPTIVDARTRLVKPDGILLPQTDTLKCALVRAPSHYQKHYQRPWLLRPHGVDMSPIRGRVINDFHRYFARDNQLVTSPEHVATLDYREITEPNLSAQVSWIIDTRVVAHGLLLWFDSVLGQHEFSNRPGGPKLIYGQAFFPFEQPLRLHPKNKVVIALRGDFLAEDYIWSWHTTVVDQSSSVLTEYRQSTFWSLLSDFGTNDAE